MAVDIEFSESVKALRDGYSKMLKDAEFLAEANKRQWEINPVSGEKLTALARDVIHQPPDISARMKKVLGE